MGEAETAYTCPECGATLTAWADEADPTATRPGVYTCRWHGNFAMGDADESTAPAGGFAGQHDDPSQHDAPVPTDSGATAGSSAAPAPDADGAAAAQPVSNGPTPGDEAAGHDEDAGGVE